jgi:hypothetical protein
VFLENIGMSVDAVLYLLPRLDFDLKGIEQMIGLVTLVSQP